MSYSALTAYIETKFNWSIQGSAVSSSIAFSPTSNSNTLDLKNSYTLGADTANEINALSSGITTISASGSATVNFQAITDILNGGTLNLVRMAMWGFNLLSIAQDSVNGTNCTGVSIGGAASNPNVLNMTGTTPAFTLHNGQFQGSGDPTAAGYTVNNTLANIKITNSDSGNAAAVLYVYGGGLS